MCRDGKYNNDNVTTSTFIFYSIWFDPLIEKQIISQLSELWK